MLCLKIDVMQFLDDKHNSKLAGTVNIHCRPETDTFSISQLMLLGLQLFSKVNVRQCFELGWFIQTMRQLAWIVLNSLHSF